MKIAPLNNKINFGFCHNATKKDVEAIKKAKPQTIDETNEFFLGVDSRLSNINVNDFFTV